MRVKLAAGVSVPAVCIGATVTVVAESRDGVTYAENRSATPEGLTIGY